VAAVVIGLSRATALPGLIDAHAHVLGTVPTSKRSVELDDDVLS
jgi:imidazolonepropionase-like amidohydrolase